MSFWPTAMFGRYLKKYGVQNTRGFFQYFYIQTKLKVNRNQNCLSTNIFNIQNDAWFLWQLWKLKSFAIIAFSNRKKYDWIFILKELISLHVSVIYIVSYLYKIKNWSRSNSFSPLCSLVFIIAKAAYGDVHPPGTSSSTHVVKLKVIFEVLEIKDIDW